MGECPHTIFWITIQLSQKVPRIALHTTLTFQKVDRLMVIKRALTGPELAYVRNQVAKFLQTTSADLIFG